MGLFKHPEEERRNLCPSKKTVLEYSGRQMNSGGKEEAQGTVNKRVKCSVGPLSSSSPTAWVSVPFSWPGRYNSPRSPKASAYNSLDKHTTFLQLKFHSSALASCGWYTDLTIRRGSTRLLLPGGLQLLYSGNEKKYSQLTAQSLTCGFARISGGDVKGRRGQGQPLLLFGNHGLSYWRSLHAVSMFL